jgi:hypothetical protein
MNKAEKNALRKKHRQVGDNERFLVESMTASNPQQTASGPKPN